MPLFAPQVAYGFGRESCQLAISSSPGDLNTFRFPSIHFSQHLPSAIKESLLPLRFSSTTISLSLQTAEKRLLMSGQTIRFLTSDEKMSSLGKHARTDERMEGDPNAFLSVLINGNCFQVNILRHPLSVRWVLMHDAVLVPGQICSRR